MRHPPESKRKLKFSDNTIQFLKEYNNGRYFDTGAYRDKEEGKLDYEGFFSPIVLQVFAEYMQKHRKQSDGEIRDSDNWQKGIPKEAYMKSMLRHQMDVWLEHRGYKSRDGMKDALCGLMFNSMGYLFELLKDEQNSKENNHL